MAYDVSTVWEVNIGGSDTNGGGFATTTVTMATNLAATLANTSAPVVTSATYTFLSRDIGHYLYIKAGTNWIPGLYPIVDVNAGAATLGAAIGSAFTVNSSFFITNVNTVVGCATVASPTNGTWSIDYSQKVTPSITYTDMVIDATTNTKFTSSANPVGPHIVGNIINVTSGTGFTVQRVQVISISGVIATCDKSLGTLSSSGGNSKLGGALATPGQVAALKIGSNSVFIRNTSGASPDIFLLSNSANVAGGRINDTVGGTIPAPNYWTGYENNRYVVNNDPNYPILKANAASVICFTSSGNYTFIRNITTDNINTGASAVAGFLLSSNFQRLENVIVRNMTSGNGGLQCTTATTKVINALVENCTSVGIAIQSSHIENFVTRNNGATGIDLTGVGAEACNGVCYNNANAGISLSSNGITVRNITSYGNTGVNGNGVRNGTSANNLCINVVSYGNAQRNYWDSSPVNMATRFLNCAGGGGGVADNFDSSAMQDFITLTANPFVNPAAGDFRLNDAPGGGLLLKATGYRSTYQGLTPANSPDIGAYQGATIMSLPDYLKNEVGTPIVWKATGGNYAMTFAGITDNNGRQGVKGDLGANRARIWDIFFTASLASAGTAGREIELWWGASTTITAAVGNPGGLSGTDATYNVTPDEYKRQLIFIGSLIISNNAGGGIQKQFLSFIPPARFGIPVIINKTGQTLGATETDFQLVFTPREEALEDVM